MKGVSQLNKWARDLKRGVEDVFILPTFNFNRYVPTQHFTYWPDVPVDVTGRVRSVATVELKTERCWVTGRTVSPIRSDRTHPVMQEPFCTLTGRTNESDRWWPDASGQRSTFLEMDRTHCRRVRSQHLPSLTLVNTISTFGPGVNRVRSIELKLRWLPVLTGRVRSRQRPRPIENKWLKRLRNVTQLEPSFFQPNFGLHLSYLVLSLINVHHT
jgi:hypothetical protein